MEEVLTARHAMRTLFSALERSFLKRTSLSSTSDIFVGPSCCGPARALCTEQGRGAAGNAKAIRRRGGCFRAASVSCATSSRGVISVVASKE